MSDLGVILWIIPSAPLLAAVGCWLIGLTTQRKWSHLPCIFGLGVACFYSFVLLGESRGREVLQHGYDWVSLSTLTVEFVLRTDALTAMMLVTVTTVALLVAVYSIGYMHGDPGCPRYFAVFSLFVFSMTMLVTSSNFLLLYVFWEAVGLCSYLLIGYWYQRPSAASAARKAFLVNRIGDFGFMLGILLIWLTFGTLDYNGVLFQEDRLSKIAASNPVTMLAICLLLFTGACGKSAQFPLHVWLPDAMEGPSPVSALIHAATMVTAGVYMVARCTPLFVQAPEAQLIVAGIGALSALLAALIAITQHDLKRVLAYSTISQLGYMFLALGSAAGNRHLITFAVVAAVFHLFTHAFFKALLFLSAGSVMHAMGDVIDMRRFGGLRHSLKYTHWLFLCGALALAGVVPFAGFWSKDEILSSAHAATHSEHYGLYMTVFYWMGLATVFLTAFYTFRAYFLTFWGAERFPPEAGDHPHEARPIMLLPMALLAVGAVFAGLLVGPTGLFGAFIDDTPGLPAGPDHHTNWTVMLLSLGLAGAGIGLAALFYARSSDMPARLQKSLHGPYNLSLNRFYMDELYGLVVVLPARLLAGVCRIVDQYLVDGLVDLVGQSPALLGRLFQPVQNGLVQFYALAMLLGLAAFVVAILIRLGT